jgi:Zn-dependent protease with chaperone function/nucleotide-binding universal stress UspA family protein
MAGPVPAPAGQLATDGRTGARASVFALPAKTSFRFALLVAAVVISSGMIYEAIYLATPRGAAVMTVIRVCLARALAPHPHGLSAYASALSQARACRAGAERTEGLWVLLGIGLLGVLAGALYGVQPWWYRRRKRLTSLTSQEAPLVIERLEQLRQLAGTSPVIWLLRPTDLRLSAFAFGTVRRRFVAVSGGAIVTQVRQPAAFDAVVLHELSHIRNRDIDQAYLAVAIWRAFAVVALVPMAGLLISRQLGSQPELLWRAVILALLVYLLRNSILRAREFDADARVAELDPDTGLGTVLAALPQRRGQRAWHLGWLHPSGQARAAALLDPAPLYECGFWDGLAVGLVAAMGAEAGQGLAYLLLTASSAGGLVPAFIFALFSAAALAAAVWRMRYWTGGTATARIWAVGLGPVPRPARGPGRDRGDQESVPGRGLREDDMNRTPRIVVGVDGFEASQAALRWAIHQARLTGAVVDAVTAWEIPPATGLMPVADLPDYQDDARVILTEAIAATCTIDAEVEVRPYVTQGRAGPVLVAAAEGADLLVVGCRDMAAWRRPCSARSGSTACIARRARSSSCAASTSEAYWRIRRARRFQSTWILTGTSTVLTSCSGVSVRNRR